ncbi:hypothetical protein HG263_18155 [Pseudoalteromonas sp. JBTF-M23]|uniref:CHASE2 domain-containing protein n=1 Tax=Pseudoalteromonas caenipelagi TaxID=2726988 RepID=A0A849VI08_9GAMM|nr:hypothetical protein [Pseudoalteromonas caenipelagi]NOU52450.1 hypothetical protein [Pseudoalteromonas caenipelagi]
MLASFILLAQYAGLFQPLNAVTYTLLNRFDSNQQSNIVLVESTQLSLEHTPLVKQLSQYNPKAIVVFSNEQLDKPDTANNVFYIGFNDSSCQKPISTWLGIDIVFEPNATRCNGWLNTLFQPLQAKQLIDFSLPITSLPKFTSKRVLSGDLFSTQVNDKIIFISQLTNNYSHSLNAPGLQSLANPVYLYAYLAHNLDKQTLVSIVPNYVCMLTLLVLLFVLVACYQKCTLSFNLKLAVLLSVTWLLISYFTVQYLQLLIPTIQLLISTWLAFLWVFFHSKWSEEQSLVRLVDDVEQRMFGRYLPKSIIENASPWEAIIKLINQQLSLEKSIFLARVEGDHRLREIHAVNCQLSDILELRRDYERSPYSDAIKELGVVKVSRPFFKALGTNEFQYITPLMYAGDIRGFWALTIIQDKQFIEQAFKRNVNRFASQIGELLYHFRMYTAQQNANKQTITRALTLRLSEPLSKKVSSSVAAMEQKLSTLEHIVDKQHTASVAFNLFGQVMQLNNAFEQLAKRQNLLIFSMNSLDLLLSVSELSISEAKGKLRYLTLNKSEFKLLVIMSERYYVLRVSSIDKTANSSESDTPFSVSGILFEFVDITELLSGLKIPNILLKQLTDNTDQNHDDSWDSL